MWYPTTTELIRSGGNISGYDRYLDAVEAYDVETEHDVSTDAGDLLEERQATDDDRQPSIDPPIEVASPPLAN